jgi:hypothetical protein
VRRGTYAPRNRAITAAQTGCVAISAIEEATLVNRRLGIQVAKCRPKNKPAINATQRSRVFIERISATSRRPAKGSVKAVPKKHRQKAIANAGAVVSAIKGPDADIPIKATDNKSTALAGGRTIAD